MDEAYNNIPIIKLWHLLLVPLQGEMTDDVAGRLMSEVLERIYRDGSSGLVIDITGLWILDSHLCSVLSQISDAANLMGAETVICGMKPEIALTLETMGVHLDNITSSLDLEGALALLGVPKPDLKAWRKGKEARRAGTASPSPGIR
ncbi:MAG TPA: STAS domain-containing protein [Polyangiaceae bacterium]|nr:STAS domain-containing protein [Polyangiaceae bacterium]